MDVGVSVGVDVGMQWVGPKPNPAPILTLTLLVMKHRTSFVSSQLLCLEWIHSGVPITWLGLGLGLGLGSGLGSGLGLGLGLGLGPVSFHSGVPITRANGREGRRGDGVR